MFVLSRRQQGVRPETPAARRMPQGDPYFGAADILLFADGIDQGARDD